MNVKHVFLIKEIIQEAFVKPASLPFPGSELEEQKGALIS